MAKGNEMDSDQFEGLIKIIEKLPSYQKKELVIIAMASDLSPTSAKKAGHKIIDLAEWKNVTEKMEEEKRKKNDKQSG